MSVRNRRLSVVTAIVVSIAVLATGCAKNVHASQSASLVNSERSRRNIRTATFDARLVNKAQAWAEQMAARGTVSHSNLASGAGSGWRYLAENVGWARSIAEMHTMFMNSPAHRASVLDGKYSKIGTGVAYRNGRYYVVQVYGG